MDPKTLQKVIEMLTERAGWRTKKALNMADTPEYASYAAEMEARADELKNFADTLKSAAAPPAAKTCRCGGSGNMPNGEGCRWC